MDFNFLSLSPAEPLEQIMQYIFSYAHLYKLGISLIILLIFFTLKNIFRKYIFTYLMKFCGNIKGNTPDYILKSFQQPVNNLIVLFGVYLALKNYLPPNFYAFLDNVYSTVVILFLTMGVYDLIGLFAENPDEIHNILNADIDKILIPFFSKILRLIIIAMSFVVVVSKWGYDVNGFIAGLGLGGLAFAMAAKDLLSNIFSGIIIITDKPFSIGDWIKTGSVEGTVEDINFRCTKIRGFDKSLVTIPNANLINKEVTNYSKREIRRVTYNMLFKYNTPAVKIEKCIDKIKNMLAEHPHIDKTTIFVKFDAFADSGYQLFLYFFTGTAVWEQYLDIKQDTNFKILQILESEGVELALPSSTVYVQPLPDNDN